MKGHTLLSIILSLQTLLCSSTHFEEVGKYSSAKEAREMLSISSADTETLKGQAQLCFDQAVDASNFEVLETLPNIFPISPMRLLHDQLTERRATILLSSNWFFNGQMLFGQELFTSHFDVIIGLLHPGDSIVIVFNTAVKLGCLGVIKTLVAGEHVDPFGERRTMVVTMSANCGHFDIVRYFVGLKAADKAWLHQVYLDSFISKSLDFVKILSEEFRVDPNAINRQTVIQAASSGNVELMKYLISRGLDLSAKGNEALLKACFYGKVEMVKFLLNSSEVNPTVNGNKAVRTASALDEQGILIVLLKDSRVLDALKTSHVNLILSRPSSNETKLFLFNWIANNMTEVNMRWIPVYKHFMLKRPQFAIQFQPFKDRAVAELRQLGFPHIAEFIEFWARALQNYATLVSDKPVEFRDLYNFILYKQLSC